MALNTHIKKFILRTGSGESLKILSRDTLLQELYFRRLAGFSCSVKRAGDGGEETGLK